MAGAAGACRRGASRRGSPLLALACAAYAGGRPAEAVYEPAARVESARLYGNINQYAYYFTDLLVGQPHPQRVSVIVDTGSSLSGFPCKGCKHCGQHIDPPFDFKDSGSATWIRCGAQCEGSCQQDFCSYTQSYTEGSSISGVWFHDLVQLGDDLQDNPPVNATLGCHVDERKLFYTQRVNGIMGMASHESSGRPTILQDLFVDKQHVRTDVFAICLAEWGGRLTVGGYEPSYHANGTRMQWIPLLHSGYYSITPHRLALDGLELAVGVDAFGTSLVDSGTTFTYFPAQVFNRLSTALVEACTRNRTACGAYQEGVDCWRLTNGATDPADFPVLTLEFEGGKTIQWAARSYLFRRGEPGLWCQAFADNGAEPGTVFGVSWMLHKNIVFDLVRSRLGVVEADCPEYRTPPGEKPGDLAGGPGKIPPVVFKLLMVLSINSGIMVVGGVVAWVLCTNCGGKWRRYDHLESLEPQDDASY